MKARVALRVTVCPRDVRFTPESGHVQCTSSCLLWAKSGHPVVVSKRASLVTCFRQRPPMVPVLLTRVTGGGDHDPSRMALSAQ
jgi:hypothetical protein